jgi:hypothetical protein
MSIATPWGGGKELEKKKTEKEQLKIPDFFVRAQ